jgi:hypothetical protein
MADSGITADTVSDYTTALNTFDAAICEAMAVGQGTAERRPLPYLGWATHVFARMCVHGVSMIRAAPQTRWVTSDYEDWSFSAVAGHARALLEGYLFFAYLLERPSSDAEWAARVDQMNLNDCTRRIALMTKVGAEKDVIGLTEQQDIIKTRLRANEYFAGLPEPVQRECLKGEKPWIKTRDQLLELVGMDKEHFGVLWIMYSQHSHILPLSFFRMEPNGRGSGLHNEVDRTYIASALSVGAYLLRETTNLMLVQFPDAAGLRKGISSKFRPGPRENLPRMTEATSLSVDAIDVPRSMLSRIISSYALVAKRSAE